jgi:hypothetical protein
VTSVVDADGDCEPIAISHARRLSLLHQPERVADAERQTPSSSTRGPECAIGPRRVSHHALHWADAGKPRAEDVQFASSPPRGVA